MATLDLNASPRTTVLRKIETILKMDPTLKRVVGTWRTWREKPGQNPPFGIEQAVGRVAIRLTPINGPDTWKFPNAFVGWLYINCEYLILGADADDPLNFWWAIENAIYPGGTGTNANVAALQAAGAYSGLTEFSIPGYDESPDGTFWACKGQMRIEVLNQLPT
jgi:hypothetical protein